MEEVPVAVSLKIRSLLCDKDQGCRGMTLSLLSIWLFIPYSAFRQSSGSEQVTGGVVEVFTKVLSPTCSTGKGEMCSSTAIQAVSLNLGS